MSRRSRLLLTVAAVVILVIVVALLSGTSSGAPTGRSGVPTGRSTPTAGLSAGTPDRTRSPAPPAATSRAGASDLIALIDQLVVAPEHRRGYSRDLFVHWIDADHDGCDTRREVLIAEAIVAPVVGSGCSLSGGEWVSLYDGLDVTDASQLDIDHVVALAEAWDSGAYGWAPQRREAFANDLGVPWALLAVSASSNRSKGDQDPAHWLPPLASARCVYAVDWVAVKTRWQLTIDAAERQALGRLARDCEASPIPSIPRP